MGCWGTGVTQSDEYCEIYERFMEEYDEGKPVVDITNDILEEYLDQFEADDGVLHDVYFALGKAEWMCGGISDKIMGRITQIIENEENIVFWRELEATEEDLILRRRNLEKFLSGLNIPRGKTRKRKISTEKYVPKEKPTPLPKVQNGDVLCYLYNEKYRIFALLGRGRYFKHPAIYCYAWKKSFDTPPTFEQLRKEQIIPLGTFIGENFPDMKNITYLGNYSEVLNLPYMFPHVINEKWRPAVHALATEANLIEDYSEELCMTFEDALARVEEVRNTIEENVKRL